MTIDIIVNKADFQRHLNGCEHRLNELKKSLQLIEKFSQKLLLNKTSADELLYFKNLNDIIEDIKFLYTSLIKLDQSTYAINNRKRLDLFKENLEKFRNKFEQIQQYAHIKFNYDYQENQFNEFNEDEQLQELIVKKNFQQEQIELDFLQNHTKNMNYLEKDLNDLHGTFIDLNRLIHDQGIIVNTIEQALTNTDEIVQEATEQVKKSVENKKRSSRMKWILIAFFICFILLVLIIIYFTLKLAFPYRK